MVKHIPPEPGAAEEEDIVREEGQEAIPEDVVQEEDTPEKGLPAHAKRQPDGSYLLPLRTPVVLKVLPGGGGPVRERRFTEVKLSRMTGADLMAVTASSPETQITTAFMRASRLNPAVATRLFQKMDGADAADASAVVGFFFGAGERTGR